MKCVHVNDLHSKYPGHQFHHIIRLYENKIIYCNFASAIHTLSLFTRLAVVVVFLELWFAVAAVFHELRTHVVRLAQELWVSV